MIVCSRPECQTSAGCKCGGQVIGAVLGDMARQRVANVEAENIGLQASFTAATARAAALEAALAVKDAALRDVLASLVAAHSLLKHGGKKAAPSDKMFEQMLLDYERSADRGRAAATADGAPLAQALNEVMTAFAYARRMYAVPLELREELEALARVWPPSQKDAP